MCTCTVARGQFLGNGSFLLPHRSQGQSSIPWVGKLAPLPAGLSPPPLF